MPIRHIRSVALLTLLAACGPGDQPEQADAPGAAEAAPEVPDVVRTADPAERGYAEGTFPRVQEVAPGVYTYEQLRGFGDDTVTTVSFFVATDEGVLVADGQGSVEETQRLLEHIAEVTPAPVRYVVIGSEHPDHTGGNAAFPEDAAVLAHPTSAERLAERGVRVTETVDSARTIELGGREIHVLHLGRAHTGGDLVVHLPQERVLFLGEVFMNRVFPSMASSYPREWMEVIDRAKELGADIYIPGHGFVDPPAVLAEELDAFRGAIARIVATTQAVHAEGAGVEDALARDLGDLESWTRAASLRESAIRRAYADLNGELIVR
ncbi:MAG TPA: MBL fold metallo-hydrolase [Longimicrobiales bacterium]|nr:MBL fold metallo-hydrolase [Longimicrobiales bacterium]